MKYVIALALAALMLMGTCSAAFVPYPTYNYDGELKAVESAPGYLPSYTIGSGENSGIVFSKPKDLTISGSRCYVSDTGNNRIVALDVSTNHPSVIYEIAAFQNGGKEDTFNQPAGLCVTESELFVADTENKRLVVFDLEGNFKCVVPAPKIDMFAVDVEYKPSKVGVDKNGRIYVVCLSVTEGVIQIDRSGNFIRFFGSNRVAVDTYELFLRMFLTKEQREKRLSFVPIEYNNLTIDDKNFVYTTTSNTVTLQVKRLNTQGQNILRLDSRTTSFYGDIHYRPSSIVDVAVDSSGSFFILDELRGRVFQYNELGDLLSVFGALGDSMGTFTSPAAIGCTADGKIYVADSVKNNITVFEPTDFGALVNEANAYLIEGRHTESMKTWQEVFKRNANFDLAYVCIGNAYMQTNEYEKAMEYYEKGNDRDGYSKAYAEYRTQVLSAAFPYIMTALVIIVILLMILKKRIRTVFEKLREFVNP